PLASLITAALFIQWNASLTHRWLREQILAICGVARSVMTKEPV
ncbi:hypothetical protein ACO0JD_24480, partial [Klebsiella pneumoniae]